MRQTSIIDISRIDQVELLLRIKLDGYSRAHVNKNTNAILLIVIVDTDIVVIAVVAVTDVDVIVVEVLVSDNVVVLV
jgi:hypothetical protein